MRGILKRAGERWRIATIVLVALALSVPFQYLVHRKVVTGLAAEHAHSHAHEAGEEHAHEEGERAHVGEEEHGGEGHPASDIPLHTNLIANYSFEVGTRETILGWASKGGERGALAFRDTRRSYRGFASAAVSSQERDFVDAGWYTRLPDTPVGYDVVFRGQVRTENLQGRAYLGVMVRGAAEGDDEMRTLLVAYADQVEGTTGWTPVEMRAYVPLKAREVWLECGMYGKGKAWFDEVSLTVEEREEYPPAGVNLLGNPSFEEGTQGWHIFLSGTETPPVYGPEPGWSGTGRSLRVENRAGIDPAAHTGFYQTIPGLSGKKGKLLLRGKIRAQSVSGRKWVDAVAFGISGSLGFMASREVAGSAEWEGFEAWIPLDGSAESLMVRLNLEGSGVLVVDDLEAVYYPAGG
ncbi:MAG: hypothetical protein ACUVT4_07715 [Actinomycetota bacterium]